MKFLLFALLTLSLMGCSNGAHGRFENINNKNNPVAAKVRMQDNVKNSIRLTVDIFGRRVWRSKVATLAVVVADGLGKVSANPVSASTQQKRTLEFLQNFFGHTPWYIGILTITAIFEHSLIFFQRKVNEASGGRTHNAQKIFTLINDIIPVSRLISDLIGFFLQENNIQDFVLTPLLAQQALMNVPFYFALWLICGNIGTYLLSLLVDKNDKKG